jgi:hypothetical protein
MLLRKRIDAPTEKNLCDYGEVLRKVLMRLGKRNDAARVKN